jgi:Putative transposase
VGKPGAPGLRAAGLPAAALRSGCGARGARAAVVDAPRPAQQRERNGKVQQIPRNAVDEPHLHQHDAEHLVYDIPKPRPDGPRALVLTPLELLDQIAALVPPPRVHRHRYYGVLAPNAPLRAAVTALAPVPVPAPAAATPDAAPHRAAGRYLWAMLLARIYEVFPLTCLFCSADMRIIVFITAPSSVRQILQHRGEPTRPPRCAPARAPLLWEAVAAAPPADNAPHWEQATQPLPELEFDQRLTW